MLNIFKPTWTLKRIYNLSVTQCQQNNIKAILTDLDNTLIAWNNPNGTQELHEWLDEMQTAGIKVIVVSNNNHERVKKALDNFNLDFISSAHKPLENKITQKIKSLKLTNSEVVIVGDQLLTDILAGHLAHVKSILVKPLITSDKWMTKINRFFEKIIYRIWNLTGFKINWQDKI